MSYKDPEKRRAAQRAYRARNVEKCRAMNKRWRERHPDYQRTWASRHNYGMSEQEYDQMLVAQQGCCAICGSDYPGPKRWHIDHDHETGQIRGLLCGKCNRGLGFFNDDPRLLQEAGDYLMSFKKMNRKRKKGAK